jgi:hypothetical protein
MTLAGATVHPSLRPGARNAMFAAVDRHRLRYAHRVGSNERIMTEGML